MRWQRRAEQPQRRPVLRAFGLMAWPIFPMAAGLQGGIKGQLRGAGPGCVLVLGVRWRRLGLNQQAASVCPPAEGACQMRAVSQDGRWPKVNVSRGTSTRLRARACGRSLCSIAVSCRQLDPGPAGVPEC